MDPVGSTQSRKPNVTPPAQARFVLIMGYWMLMIAFGGAHITLVSQDYRNTLLASLILSILSAPCLAFAFSRGKIVTRILALVGGVVVFIIVAETVCRLF